MFNIFHVCGTLLGERILSALKNPFEQVENGKFVRMALMMKLLEVSAS